MHEPYRVLSEPDPFDPAISGLTELQLAQLRAAANYHVLMHPGAEIELRISIGAVDQMPVLAGGVAVQDRAARPESPKAEPAEQGATLDLRLQSTAVGKAGGKSNSQDEPAAPVVRRVRLSHPDATIETTRPAVRQSLPRRGYDQLELRAPWLVDLVREGVTRRRERGIAGPLPRYPHGDVGGRLAAAVERAPAPAPPREGAPPAVLFGMHWLQPSGAERWAVETIGIAKSLGVTPIVVTDHDSVHPWLTRPELEGAIVVALDEGHNAARSDEHANAELRLARALLENFELRGAVIHHGDWLYRALPYLKRHQPGLPVVDSLHVVEYLGGGFAGSSVAFDAFIDRHHVISPQLVDWLGEQGVDAAKIDLAPLAALTAGRERPFAAKGKDEPFTIAYIGRFSRQKRPDLFLALANALQRQGVEFRAIMHGSGECRPLVDSLIERYGLAERVELRDETTPVAETLKQSHLLVITSLNEGLTLTTFEAVAAGIPVLSADVGSQSTIVRGDLLVPRPAYAFLRAAGPLVAMYATGGTGAETLRKRAWRAQRDRVREFSAHPDAHDYFEGVLTAWLR